MAEAATPTKKKPSRKPAKKPASAAKKPAPDDGGLREDDRARLKELVEQRRKKEAAARRSEKQAAKSGPPKSGKPAGKPEKAAPAPAPKKAPSAANKEQAEPARRETDQGWRFRMRRLHEILLDRLGNNPERVPTASHAPTGHGIVAADRTSPRKVINWALDLLPDETKGYTFIDMGCGRGRVVLEASRRPFDRIVGIERDLARYEDAMLNLRHWPRSIMACRNVDLVHGNAGTWKLPPGDIVVYLFDPFDDRAMFNLATRLNRHVESGYKAVVIYLDPSFSLPLRESPYFRQVMPLGLLRRKIETFSPYPLEVYASTQPDGSIPARHTRKGRRSR